MKTFLKHNWLYLISFFSIVCVAIYHLLKFDKVRVHMYINNYVGNPITDEFFKYVTHLGDGMFAVAVGIFVLIKNIRNGIYLLAVYIVSGLTTTILKNFKYSHINRPHFVFEFYLPNEKINYVEGVEMLGLNSFPSGHATSALALFTALTFITPNKYLKFLFFLIGIITAFSRTYLSQHWLVDITAGGTIGVIAAIVLYFVFLGNKFQNLNKPLTAFIKR